MDIKKNETWLIKNLRRYSIEEIMFLSLEHSLNYESRIDNSFIETAKILPWHLDSLLLMKLVAGDSNNYKTKLSHSKFMKMINIIADFENSFINQDILDVMTRIIINQKPYQTNTNILQFRANFLFNYKNEHINMKKEFENTIGANPNDVEQLFIILKTILISDSTDLQLNRKLINTILKDEKSQVLNPV